jgi:hypothetical protein
VNKDINDLKTQYLVEVAMNCYNYSVPYVNPSISVLILNNLLIGLLKDIDFVSDLTKELQDCYPLNTLTFEPRYIKETISTLNTLRLIWIQSNHKDDVVLDYIKPYQHLAHTVTQPFYLIKELGCSNIKSYRVKHNFFLGDNLLNDLHRPDLTIFVGSQRYIINQELSQLGDVAIPTSSHFHFENVLTQEFLETDEYSDIMYEMDSTEIDMELIESSLMDSSDIYEESQVKKRGRSICLTVKWVILPNIEHSLPLAKYINNTGENVVILSNCLIKKFQELRCNRIYLVNYSRFHGEIGPMFAHVMSTKKINGSFWDKYIGGRKIDNSADLQSLTYSGIFRVKDKSINVEEGGKRIIDESNIVEQPSIDIIPKNTDDDIKKWTDLGFSEEEATENLRLKNESSKIREDIDNTINEYLEKGLIDKHKAMSMKQRYKAALISKINYNYNNVLSSFLTEMELININTGIMTGDITSELTSTEHIKMMQAPESFGTAYLHSKPDSKSFKDIRYKAEIDSIHEGLSELIASSTLTISTKMFDIVKSHYNLWRGSVSVTKYRVENKKFFLNTFLSVVNTASMHKTSKHDLLWQDLINTFALIIGEEPTDSDMDLGYRLPPSSGLRLKYKTVTLQD